MKETNEQCRLDALTEKELAGMFDHTCLKAYATEHDLETLCQEAQAIGAAMVAINTEWTDFCKHCLKDSPVHVGAAISFPLGQSGLETKCFETEEAIRLGADEIDYVIHIGKAKMHDWAYLEEEMRRIVKICREHGVVCKVIFENCYLDPDEIQELSRIAAHVQPDFIKTSTGFGPSGAKAEDVALMKANCGDHVQVKAAGGIRSWDDCKAMLEAGATRIGTSSSKKILEEFRASRK